MDLTEKLGEIVGAANVSRSARDLAAVGERDRARASVEARDLQA